MGWCSDADYNSDYKCWFIDGLPAVPPDGGCDRCLPGTEAGLTRPPLTRPAVGAHDRNCHGRTFRESGEGSGKLAQAIFGSGCPGKPCRNGGLRTSEPGESRVFAFPGPGCRQYRRLTRPLMALGKVVAAVGASGRLMALVTSMGIPMDPSADRRSAAGRNPYVSGA